MSAFDGNRDGFVGTLEYAQGERLTEHRCKCKTYHYICFV